MFLDLLSKSVTDGGCSVRAPRNSKNKIENADSPLNQVPVWALTPFTLKEASIVGVVTPVVVEDESVAVGPD